MTGILNGLKNIIGIFKLIIEMIMSFYKMIGLMFAYTIKIITILGDIALTTPLWLRTFIVSTMAISVIYLIVGRTTGKSD